MKRILACLLAASFLLLPVSAAAVESGEATGVFQGKEQAVKVPYSTVKAQCEGGGEYLDKYGVTRRKLVAELSAHEHDSFYLGTPEIGGDSQSPNGDVSYNGYAGMNCAGFVSYVLRKSGMNPAAVMRDMRKGSVSTWGSPRRYNILSGASNYYNLVRYGKLKAYAFPTKQSLLKSGKCEKGDLILRYWTSYYTDDSDEDNHMMIFWGSQPSEDKVWHSASGRNHIGQMWNGSNASFILIKFAPESPPVAGFEDVREKNWFAASVRYVKEKGLMVGVTADSFQPESPVTRGQIVSLLYRLSGRPKPEYGAAFEDVPPDKWYTDAIAWASSNGIVSGYSENEFGPNDVITREDMAAMLWRYSRFRGLDTAGGGDLSAFQDASQISEYALDAMTWAVGTGLIAGTGPDTLLPGGTAARAQAAAVLTRFCEKYGLLLSEEGADA